MNIAVRRGFLVVTILAGALSAADAAEEAADEAARVGVVAQPAPRANRLIDSNDPYLLQHAHNPVDWYPWSPEALEKARRENRPIFVSVGYSTCYWCHVAERTIYANPEIAKLMNEWFVNIKVGREQRPDLDRVYMLATQLITGRGGWPNNVFLTPDLKPFYAGSYFPPADDDFGRPGFPTLLKAIHDAWTHRRAEVEGQADAVHEAMQEAMRHSAGGDAAPVDAAAARAGARDEILRDFDPRHGGLGRGATKFPREPALTLLLADFRRTRDAKVGEALAKTLDAMAFDGIRDHLGGGFHRYSTEPTWSVPHFEKMLHDNAQLLSVYTEAYALTRAPLYRQVAEEIAEYLTQRMMAPAGGFHAAEDADVDGREGASYLWSRRQIVTILGEAAAERFLRIYGLAPLPEPPAGGLPGADEEAGVLRVRLPLAGTLRRAGAGDVAATLAALAPERAKLLAARARRPQPARDDKIIVAWNAMAVAALARSAQVLERPRDLELASRTAEMLWARAFDPAGGRLRHELFRGRAQIDAYLDDHALLGIAFLELAGAGGEALWRERAAQLADVMLERFGRGGILATTAADDLLVAPRDDGDSTMPSGTSAALELLLRLAALTGRQDYADGAARVLAQVGGALRERPGMWASAVAALDRHPLPAAARGPAGAAQALATAAVVHAEGRAESAGDHEEIVVAVTVDEGFHVNANPASFDYLIPTTLTITGAGGARIAYPAPRTFKPSFAREGLKVYEGTFELRARLPKGSLGQAEPARAALRVQACNDEVCLPPDTLPLVVRRQR